MIDATAMLTWLASTVMTSGARPVFLGNARIEPQERLQLAPLMRMIALERGDGSFELQLK